MHSREAVFNLKRDGGPAPLGGGKTEYSCGCRVALIFNGTQMDVFSSTEGCVLEKSPCSVNILNYTAILAGLLVVNG